jgi:cell division transport system ATP-binding protein
MEKSTAGAVLVGGQNLGSFRARPCLYRRRIGMVFQDQKLLFDRNAFENVMLPLSIAGFPPREAGSACAPRSTRSGWASARKACRSCFPAASSSAWRSPAPWSAGPDLLLADEPTAHLDAETAATWPASFMNFTRSASRC